MYGGIAERVTIDTDERGFSLVVVTDEGTFSFDVQAIASEVLAEVKREIGPWDAERKSARLAFLCTSEDVDESAGAYELSDPKHPTYHERMSDVADGRF